MGLIEDELEEVRKLCEHLIAGSRLISCVRSMVRVEIKRTQFKQLVICIQFPEDYPASPLLIELKSKTLVDQLLAKVTTVCEEEAKKYLGKPQILKVLKLLRNFIDENPLSCCYNEVLALKKQLQGDLDELKVRQKTSSLILRVQQGNYYLRAKILVPDDYPASPLLIELKSKTLVDQLLAKVTTVCEEEAKKYLGKPQILKVLKLLRNFIDENPLSCCYNEVLALKKQLQGDLDELKVRQKTSSLILRVQQGNYYLRAKILVPDDYPLKNVGLEDVDTNFPPLFERFFVAQAKEISRQCIEPPLQRKPSDVFSPKPSVLPTVSFLIEAVKTIPQDKCQFCQEQCLPPDPQNVEKNESADMHVERVYCGHLFHLQCLITYMKTPPFKGGKKCPLCNKQIFHDKWKVSERLAEVRWAHQQARERELQEVSEFFE
uniref:RING-type domain-containing protein n=1 Tax=Homalodisca liturata TaxID=320908 RepID=A0A1B6IQ42_9HEMI